MYVTQSNYVCAAPYSLTDFRSRMSSYANFSGGLKVTKPVLRQDWSSSPDVGFNIPAVTPWTFAYPQVKHVLFLVTRLFVVGQNPSARIAIEVFGNSSSMLRLWPYFDASTSKVDLSLNTFSVLMEISSEDSSEQMINFKWNPDGGSIGPAEWFVTVYYTQNSPVVVSESDEVFVKTKAGSALASLVVNATLPIYNPAH